MSVDELWSLHEEIRSILSMKLDAEKLERRQLNGNAENRSVDGHAENSPKSRRRYPKVRPKHRNPERPSEAWSGRGKRPRWMSAQLKSGKKVDEFLIARPRYDLSGAM
jgi:DNA-binding protein H-NS